MSLATNPVRRIVSNFWQEKLVDEAPFDGMVELNYDSMEGMRLVWGIGQNDTMCADKTNFYNPDFRVFFIAKKVEVDRKTE